MCVELTPEETQWRDDLERRLPKSGAEDELTIRELAEMRDLAARLHDSLASHGHAPAHRFSTIMKGVNWRDPRFYSNVGLIRDLIAFTYNPRANQPEDVTMGAEFEFRVHSRRLGRDVACKLIRTPVGWFMEGEPENGVCDSFGDPYLAEFLRYHGIRYPRDLGTWFRWLWQQAREHGLDRERVQQGINEIAGWVNSTEQNAPNEGVWAGLK